MKNKVYWQFHQSTNREMPQNTMAAFRYAWDLGGIPELDIRTSKDGVIICFHDRTPKDLVMSDKIDKNREISSFNYAEISKWNVGGKVPAVKDVFKTMAESNKKVYLDLKEVNLKDLAKLIEKYRVARKVIFTHKKQGNLIKMKELVPGIKTMLWIGGTPEAIKNKFKKVKQSGFDGLDQVQLHLHDKKIKNGWRYVLELDYLKYAAEQTGKGKIDLEVLPYKFDKKTLFTLLDTGIFWYAVDEPKRFTKYVNEWNQI